MLIYSLSRISVKFYCHDISYYILQGSYFDRGATLGDYRVLLELTECPEVNIVTNRVWCEPPKKAPPVDKTGAYEQNMIRVKVIHHYMYLYSCDAGMMYLNSTWDISSQVVTFLH